MPYIHPAHRLRVDVEINALAGAVRGLPELQRAGVLNYTVTRLLRGTVLEDSAYSGPPNYAAHNEALGVLEAVKLEIYRRLTAPYEDAKIAANGDVR